MLVYAFLFVPRFFSFLERQALDSCELEQGEKSVCKREKKGKRERERKGSAGNVALVACQQRS